MNDDDLIRHMDAVIAETKETVAKASALHTEAIVKLAVMEGVKYNYFIATGRLKSGQGMPN